jgi:precorrin-6B methylase 2
MHVRIATRLIAASISLVLFSAPAFAQATQKPYEPQVGQAGKDVVWVPTPQVLVEKMLDMAKVTPQDYVIDLGSGDGRTVIAAAKRGATAHGIEYNPDMVALAQANAKEAGVSAKATFAKADLFESDFSKAQVITMFLLPSINMTLRPKLLDMKPGTRIVTNSFTMEDWEADQSETVTDDCTSWCTAHLWIVPAKVEGSWTMPAGTLTLKQNFQNISGTLGSIPLTEGKLRGAQIEFTAGGQKYTGTVNGNTINGQGWTATRK